MRKAQPDLSFVLRYASGCEYDQAEKQLYEEGTTTRSYCPGSLESVTNGGALPYGWQEYQLRELVLQISAGTSVNGEDRAARGDEIGVLKVSCVFGGTFAPMENKAVVARDISRVRTPVTAGTIIVSRANTPELVGASVYVAETISNLYHSDKLWQIHPKPARVRGRFLAHLLASPHVQQQFANLATGTSKSMKNISQDKLLALKLAVPPLAEQDSILEILAAAENAVQVTYNTPGKLDRTIS